MEKNPKTPKTSKTTKTKLAVLNTDTKKKESPEANKSNNDLISIANATDSNKNQSITNSGTVSKINNDNDNDNVPKVGLNVEKNNLNTKNNNANVKAESTNKPKIISKPKTEVTNKVKATSNKTTNNSININPSNKINLNSANKNTTKNLNNKSPAPLSKNKNEIKTELDIPIDFLNLKENRILPSQLISNLPEKSLSKSKSASSYNIPLDPLQRVDWTFSLFKSKEKLLSYAQNAPPRENSTLDAVAEYLNSFSDDILEKYMLLFSWVTMNIQYDTNSYFTGKITAESCSAAVVFRNGSGVCSGYSTIFGALCGKLNLNCLSVVGYAKGYQYQKGDKMRDSNHEWSLVELSGEWFFIETTWASGKLGSDKKFIFEFNPFYFFCPPQFFIEDHLPENPQFQLLETPLSKSQYESAFFYKLSNNFEVLFKKMNNFAAISPMFFVIDYDYLTNETQEFQIIKLKNVNKEISAILYKIENKKDSIELKIENRILIKELENEEFEILYKIPSNGNYIIKVFERDIGIKEPYLSFINYYIHAKNVEKNNFEFVKRFAFEKKCELIEPYSRMLKIGTKIDFKLRLVNCTAVSVVQESVWFNLQRNKEENDLWEASVEIKQKKIIVFAKKDQDKSFSGVFEYEGI
jgi:hypothetical protein